MGHDQIWKDVMWTFFEPFIRLFFPEIAGALDFSTAQLVEGEVFTDVPDGNRREPDVVIQVNRTDGNAEIVLIHVEVQSERRGDVPYRMWEYYSLLRLRKKLPVFPIVVFLAPGAGGLVSEGYQPQCSDAVAAGKPSKTQTTGDGTFAGRKYGRCKDVAANLRCRSIPDADAERGGRDEPSNEFRPGIAGAL